MNKFESGNKERRVGFLQGHIAVGIDLIQTGQGKAAYYHFASYRFDDNSPEIRPGRICQIKELLTEDDLIFAVIRVTSTSKINGPYSAEIGGWYVDSKMNMEFEDLPEIFDPGLVKRFYYEVALVAAEEWLHILQETAGLSLAGHIDQEVDIAAYLDNLGLPLSADFLTRYLARAGWSMTRYPERIEEVRRFAQKYHRLI